MITSLTIKNYALIDEISVDFSSGFTVITGETGAGKSIILGALSLVLGKRADTSSITNKSLKCIVEANFDIAQYELSSFFKAHALDFDAHTIIRREILPSGKSRAFINDTPVTLDVLSTLSAHLLDIHAQHDNLTITDDKFQFQVLDGLAGNKEILLKYQQTLKDRNDLIKKLEHLNSEKSELVKEHDYTNYLLNELEEVQLDGSLSDLEEEHEKLSNVEDIKQNLNEALGMLEQEQYGILDNLIQLKSTLTRISQFSAAYQKLFDRIDSIHIELKDVLSELEDHSDQLEIEPERLQQVSEILNRLQTLMVKHNVQTVEELIEVKQTLSEKTVLFEQIDDTILKTQQMLQETEKSLSSLASELASSRKKVIPKLTEELTLTLDALGISSPVIEIDLKASNTYHQFGNENLQFLFSANKGQIAKPLKQAASGGELSRVMLSIKAILARYQKLPTIIFDEIDTGVSGEIATKMATLMYDMSKHMQLLSITHLPQIAARGDGHFKVFKEDGQDKTITKLVSLNQDERVVEIAEMLGGKQLSNSALEHAKQLLN